MSNKKLFSAKEAALAVLARAKTMLEESSLMKAEKLKKDQSLGQAIGFPGSGPAPAPTQTPMPKSEMKKYETENRKAPGVKYGKIEKDVKPVERDYNEYEVKPGNSKDSSGPRLKKQVSPSGNPREEAEGNNKPDGMEPEFEFKDRVSKELAKEKASHMVKSQSGMHTVMYKSAVIEKSEDQKNDLKKSENPDKEQDAALGEKVENDVEQHFKENKEAEAQEGHELMAKPGDKMEGQSERASIPRLILSAKLSKFMEHKHSKRKAAQGAQSQAPAAVGQPAANAPQQGSSESGRPDNSRPKTQPTDGDVNKMGKK